MPPFRFAIPRRPRHGRAGAGPLRPRWDRLEARQLLAVVVAEIAPVEDVPFYGRVATFQEGDVSGPAKDFTATIDWGDGSTITAVKPVASGSEFAIDAGHTYETDGPRRLVVTVFGTEGTTSLGTAAIVVSDAPLTATGRTITANAGSPFTGIVASFEDAQVPPGSAGDFLATVAWGDGVVTQGAIREASPGRFEVQGSHTYTLPSETSSPPSPLPLKVAIVRVSSNQSVTATGQAVWTRSRKPWGHRLAK